MSRNVYDFGRTAHKAHSKIPKMFDLISLSISREKRKKNQNNQMKKMNSNDKMIALDTGHSCWCFVIIFLFRLLLNHRNAFLLYPPNRRKKIQFDLFLQHKNASKGTAAVAVAYVIAVYNRCRNSLFHGDHIA